MTKLSVLYFMYVSGHAGGPRVMASHKQWSTPWVSLRWWDEHVCPSCAQVVCLRCRVEIIGQQRLARRRLSAGISSDR
jgi:hypothetical protein